MKLLAVSGSLRAASTNSRLVAAAARLAPVGTDVALYSRLHALPPFNPDLDIEGFPEVLAWCDAVRSADGLILSFPEYAGGYPGVLKNAFDWLVATDAHVEKPFMTLSTSARSTLALDSFKIVLRTMSGVCIEEAATTVPLLGTTLGVDDIVADATLREPIEQAIERFVSAISTLRVHA